MRSPEVLLFTDKRGNSAQLQDVMDDGLDGGYEDRIPELEELLETGLPPQRFMACMLLTAWGRPSGFRKLIEWASNPSHTPWVTEPFTFDRIYGAEDAFANLADALKTSFWNDPTPQLRKMQFDGATALLRIYSDYFFDRKLALAIAYDKSLAESLDEEICSTLERCLVVLRVESRLVFDLAYQTASLILPLVSVDDNAAARYADQLALCVPGDVRTLRELAQSLASGIGPATKRSLENLSDSANSAVAKEAARILATRQERK